MILRLGSTSAMSPRQLSQHCRHAAFPSAQMLTWLKLLSMVSVCALKASALSAQDVDTRTVPATSAAIVTGRIIQVANATELRSALKHLSDGLTIRIAPGEYGSGYNVQGVANLSIAGLDPEQPPHFQGGKSAWHFARCPNLKLSHLRVSGQSQNGINLDDGGDLRRRISGIVLENVHVSDIGPQGNFDGIKASGLEQLTIRKCSVTGWAGQGIDLVGCHQVVIHDCRFVGKAGYSATAAVQIKGGSSQVTIRDCHFLDAGQRPLNVGGSTGLAYFRPQGAPYEARQVTVTKNLIQGSQCAAAFVGVDGAVFSDNTILFPTKWIFRILQESRGANFVPCRNVVIQHNRIVFERAAVNLEINIGDGTAPDSFRFVGNHWFASDRPAASKPRLPTEETGGTYGVDPRAPDTP